MYGKRKVLFQLITKCILLGDRYELMTLLVIAMWCLVFTINSTQLVHGVYSTRMSSLITLVCVHSSTTSI
jgi:hypothetical protein